MVISHLTLKVRQPFWLQPVMWLFIRLYSIPALFGREASEAEVERISRWFANRLTYTVEPVRHDLTINLKPMDAGALS